ncbi:unnamed protein product [Musa textilis]
MPRLLLLGMLILDLVAMVAGARPTPTESRVIALVLSGPHSASAPSLSARPSGGESGPALIGKCHRPLDKSIAGAEVMLGGLATAIFAYIRVTRKTSSETEM